MSNQYSPAPLSAELTGRKLARYSSLTTGEIDSY